ncbi:MAG TPA: signal recognition particle-docking protein FtsY [Acidimicrobiales bacterium]|nr:signal recognition particle-docking protein FtsY [Acidimicrobiales bacterium]
MTTVLVVVIVLLLVVLGAGTAVYVRRGQSAGGTRPPRGPRAPVGPGGARSAPPPPTSPEEVRAGAPGAGERTGRAVVPETEPAPAPAPDEARVAGAPARGREGIAGRIGRARDALAGSLGAIRSRSRVDETTFEQLEEALLLADVGLPTTSRFLDDLRSRVRAGAIPDDASALLEALKQDVVSLFAGEDRSLHLADGSTSVWLFVGVNGVGKTTTIGKLAAREAAAGRAVVLAAGDTFRAAAGEQLATWAERSGARIVRGSDGADPSSVVFDAVQHAAARGAALVLADTAGRLHTKVNLMDELRKVRRVADRPPGSVAEVLLVLDATTGQNGLVQAREFAEAVEVTGVVLTKLDGTAKGGIVCAIRSELGIPIKLVGVGEGVDDLVVFDPVEFADALFS